MRSGFTGSCLCGAITYESSEEPRFTGHCHCVDCRKTSGTGHATHVAVAKSALAVEGEVKFYERPADSGNIVARGFCPDCGSAVYSTNEGMPDLVFVRASSLDDPETAKPQLIVYTDQAPSWDVMDTNLPSYAEMPTRTP